MATFEKVRALQQQGYNDSMIARTLQEDGISPREINDALSQSRIKNAVSQQDIQGNYSPDIDMQPSMMDQNLTVPTPNSNFQPMPQEGPYAQEVSQGYQQPEFYDPQQSPDQYQGYQDPSASQGDYGGYGGQQAYEPSSETVTEIASQIISEQMKKTNRIVNELTENKILLNSKVEKMDERLDRIERIIDSLQTLLVRKATEQEQNIDDIKNEMVQMQEGFSKVINPLFDIERSLEKPIRKTVAKTSKKKK